MQGALGIEPRASHVAAVRNPETPAPPRLGRSPALGPTLPAQLREKFSGSRVESMTPRL
jgi:hypothetical protein